MDVSRPAMETTDLDCGDEPVQPPKGCQPKDKMAFSPFLSRLPATHARSIL
ncbi:MAG TPA: hypothetical protein PKN13_04450 [Accumulibacter sp.]|nr:hypothetical protein [Accumulibacter sp.]HND79155.1 hypothetical protein [Accumulibacter sp.]HNE13454.1 hypothetical protein [Accumulibacter sp.]HNG38679.1 hypothetical protein [Accumulibacter sp.]HNL12728.1 hypothetical protein [Accumulibacter sp.]